jgi:hypothetical protein
MASHASTCLHLPGESKGFGYVEFQKDIADAATDRAVSLNGRYVGGKAMVVKYSDRDWLKKRECVRMCVCACVCVVMISRSSVQYASMRLCMTVHVPMYACMYTHVLGIHMHFAV